MVRRGKLAPDGVAVHAATFLREGRMILDRELLRRPRELRRIFVHELCHFVWWKLGNPRRFRLEALLAQEFKSHARGELGWSSEWRKQLLTARDIAKRTRAWREYCCESFCDTGSFVAGGNDGEVTLGRKWMAARVAWFKSRFGGEVFLI